MKEKLREGLLENKTIRRFQDEVYQLQNMRHRRIRDILVRIRNQAVAKYHFLKTIEKSEEKTKKILVSEDYPEVQLILQQTMKEKLRKQQRSEVQKYTTVSYELGEAYLNEERGFNPVKKKTGSTYTTTMAHSLGTKKYLEEKKRDKNKFEKQKRNIKGKVKKIGKVKKTTNTDSSLSMNGNKFKQDSISI